MHKSIRRVLLCGLLLLTISCFAAQLVNPSITPPVSSGGSGGNTVAAGTNINVVTVGSTATVSLNDPANLNKMVVTNLLTATNGFGGTVVDFSSSSWLTNGTGTISFSGIKNLTLGAQNDTIITIIPNGSDQIIGAPPAFKVGLNATLVATNGNVTKYWFSVWPGVYSNMYELQAH